MKELSKMLEGLGPKLPADECKGCNVRHLDLPKRKMRTAPMSDAEVDVFRAAVMACPILKYITEMKNRGMAS